MLNGHQNLCSRRGSVGTSSPAMLIEQPPLPPGFEQVNMQRMHTTSGAILQPEGHGPKGWAVLEVEVEDEGP